MSESRIVAALLFALVLCLGWKQTQHERREVELWLSALGALQNLANSQHVHSSPSLTEPTP